jgi:hypothetical protein
MLGSALWLQGYPGGQQPGAEPYGRPEGARFHFPGSQAPAAGYNRLPGGYGGPGRFIDPGAPFFAIATDYRSR